MSALIRLMEALPVVENLRDVSLRDQWCRMNFSPKFQPHAWHPTRSSHLGPIFMQLIKKKTIQFF